MSLLRDYLVDSRLAGDVATTPRQTIDNCHKLADGDPDYTFGLDVAGTTADEALDAVVKVCGGDPRSAHPDGPGWIDPDATLAAIGRHTDVLAQAARAGARVLFATGHPTGLLPHYAALGRALTEWGCKLLAPLDDVWLTPYPTGRRKGIRFIDGVACEFDGASLRHTHRSDLMVAMLDEIGGGPGEVDLVVADHGLAGAAISRGLPTLSIADVNDPGLPLAQVRGWTDAVLPIDDNLAPRLFLPVTEAMLVWSQG